MKPRTIVVEGAGDIVDRGYGPALAKLLIDNPRVLRVIYTDSKDIWREQEARYPGIMKKRERTLRKLKKWGAEFVDRSESNAAERERYLALRDAEVDTVLIATNDASHIDVAEHWLDGNCSRVFIEKPLTSANTRARALDLKDRGDPRVFCFDHYRARVHGHLHHQEMLDLIDKQLGHLTKFRFYLLEDRSGTDPTYIQILKRDGLKNRNGPIENERRQASLTDGLILDLMPHTMALLSYFGHIGEVDVRTVRAAQYTGVDFIEDARAEINGETLAAIEFGFKNLNNDEADGEAFVAKGVRGSRKHPEMNGNVRLIELEGQREGHPRKIQFDFRNNVVWYVSGREKRSLLDLERDPYYYFAQEIFYSRAGGTRLGLSINHGKTILEHLVEMRHGIKNPIKDTYPLGTRTGRAQYFEDIVEKLPPVFGKSSNI